MTEDDKRRIQDLVERLPRLTRGQLHWVGRVVEVFGGSKDFQSFGSDLLQGETLESFGDALRIHHCFSVEPFSKDKFEYTLQTVLTMAGRSAQLAPKGNRGHDISIDGVRYSLKTQADKGIKEDRIWISKFMELGKGTWRKSVGDLKALLEMLACPPETDPFWLRGSCTLA